MAALTLWLDHELTSPWAHAVWAILGEKQLGFTPRPVDLGKGEQHEAPYRARALTRKIPALEHGPLALSESLAIIEYLDEAFPAPHHRPVWPSDRAARARDRAISCYLRSDFGELRRTMPYECLFGRKPAGAPNAQALREVAELVRLAAPRAAAGVPAAPTLADLELAFMLRRTWAGEVPLGDATVTAWVDALWQRPTVQTWVTAKRP